MNAFSHWSRRSIYFWTSFATVAKSGGAAIVVVGESYSGNPKSAERNGEKEREMEGEYSKKRENVRERERESIRERERESVRLAMLLRWV